MSHFTTPLGLTLANPGTGEPFSTAVVNGDFVLLDTAILADRVRLTSLEGQGAIRSGTTGGALWLVSTLAALDGLSTAKVGDIAYMTDPGNGNVGTGTIGAMSWLATSGSGAALKWSPNGIITAPSLANLNTFQAAVTGDLSINVGQQARLADTPGVVYEYAALYATPGNINGRETAAGWFIVLANIRRHYDNVINIGSTATGTNIPAAALVVRRRTYAQRISVKFAGSISGTTSGGMGITASAGGTVTSNFGAIAIGGSGVAYAGQAYVDIAAGVGADVTISGGTIGTGPMIIGGLLTYDISLPGEYS